MRTLILWLMLAAPVLGAPTWSATPDAPHLNAAVEVSLPMRGGIGGFGGAGTVVGADSRYIYVLTCHHVISDGILSRAKAKWRNGATLPGRVVASQAKPDLALIVLDHQIDPSGLLCVPLASSSPSKGTLVEVTGYGVDGNGGGDLRHFYAEVLGYGPELILKTSVVSGDSGGGVFSKGTLVGVIYGGPNNTGGFVHPASATNVEQIRAFVQKAGCITTPSGTICYPPGSSLRGRGPFRPPTVLPQVPTTPRPTTPRPKIQDPPPTLGPGPKLGPVSPPAVDICPEKGHIGALESKINSLERSIGQQVTINQSWRTESSRNQKISQSAARESITKVQESTQESITKVQESIRENKAQLSLFGKVQARIHERLFSSSTIFKILGLLGITGIPGVIIGFVGWRLASRVRDHIGDREDPIRPFPESAEEGEVDVWRDFKKCRESLREANLEVARLEALLEESSNHTEIEKTIILIRKEKHVLFLENQKLVAEISRCRAEITRLEQLIRIHKDGCQEKTKDDSCQERVKELQKEVLFYQETAQSLRNSYEKCRKDAILLKETLLLRGKELEELKKNADGHCRKKIEDLKSQNEELQRALSRMTGDYGRACEKITELQGQITELQGQDDCEERLAEYKRMVQDLQEEIARLNEGQKDCTEWERELARCRQNVERLEDKIKDHEKNEARLLAEIDRLREDARRNDWKPKYDRLRDENRDLRAEIDDLKEALNLARDNTRTEYVHVPVTNDEAEAYKEALRRSASQYPNYEPFVRIVESVAEQIYHGRKVRRDDKRDPLRVDEHEVTE